MIIHDTVEQGTEAWMKLRCGRVTASELHAIMNLDGELKRAKGSKTELSEGAHTYLCRKAAEIVRGAVEFGGGSWATEQGHFREEQAIPWYELEYDVDVKRVGFIEDGQFGCSPDGLIGDDDRLEVKSPEPTAHVRYLLAGDVPKDYFLQVHGSMFATGRPRWTFLSYHSDLPKLVVEVARDEALMKTMAASLAEFLERLNSAVARIREMESR